MELVIFTSADRSRAAIAAAVFNALVAPSQAVAIPAVRDPGAPPEEDLGTVLRELAPQILIADPARLTHQLTEQASLVVFVGCSPDFFPVNGVPHVEWSIPAPRLTPVAKARVVRDSILRSVEELLRARKWTREHRDACR
jgi:arsenate reductase (thioredoxin)